MPNQQGHNKHMSKKQIKQFQANESRNKKRKLMDQLGLEHGQVTDNMVEESLIKSRINRLQSFLQTKTYIQPTTKGIEVTKKVARIPEMLGKLPYKEVLKKHVGWLKLKDQDSNSSLSLTEELDLFAQYVKLDAGEISSRKALIEDMKELVKAKWPDAVVNAFGSYAANLSIFLSDIDLSILFPNDLEQLSREKMEVKDSTITTYSAAIPPPPSLQGKLIRRTGDSAKGDQVIDLSEDTPNVIDLISPSESEREEGEVSEEVEVTWEVDTNPIGGKPMVEKMTEKEGEKESEDVQVVSLSSLPPPPIEESESPRHRSITKLLTVSTEREKEKGKEGERVEESVGQKRKLSIDDDDEEEEVDTDNNDSDDNDSDDSEEDSESTSTYESDDERDTQSPSHIEGETDSKKMSIKPVPRIEEDIDIQVIDPSNNTDSTTTIDYLHPNAYQLELLSSEPDLYDSRINAFLDDDFIIGTSTKSLPIGDGEGDYPYGDDLYEDTYYDEEEERERERRERDRQIGLLRQLFTICKQMDWIDKMEFRQRARVPIINLLHSNRVECDISLGLQAKDTSELLQRMKEEVGERVLFTLSAFLKVYLYQLGLDAPFVGGLGSFKLYVLIASYCEREIVNDGGRGRCKEYRDWVIGEQLRVERRKEREKRKGIADSESESEGEREVPNYGLLLLSFLQYYGDSKNLNARTVIDLYGDEKARVSFESSKLVPQIQRAFQRAYVVLNDKCRERWLTQREHFTSNTDRDREKEGDKKGRESGNMRRREVEDKVIDLTSDFSDSDNDSDFSDSDDIDSEESDTETDSYSDSERDSDNDNDSHSDIERVGKYVRAPNATTTSSVQRSQYSSSLLGCLLDTASLSRERSLASRQCLAYPYRPGADRDRIAQEIIDRTNKHTVNAMHGSLTLSQIQAFAPLLAAKLRSFYDPNRAFSKNSPFSHQGSENVAQSGYSHGGSNNGVNSGSSSKRYSFSSYGVVGDAIKATTPHIGMTPSTKKLARYARSDAHQTNRDRRASYPFSEREKGREREREIARDGGFAQYGGRGSNSALINVGTLSGSKGNSKKRERDEEWEKELIREMESGREKWSQRKKEKKLAKKEREKAREGQNANGYGKGKGRDVEKKNSNKKTTGGGSKSAKKQAKKAKKQKEAGYIVKQGNKGRKTRFVD